MAAAHGQMLPALRQARLNIESEIREAEQCQ